MLSFVLLAVQRQHIYSYILLLYCCCCCKPVQPNPPPKMEMKTALANPVCLLALSSGMYEEKAQQSTAQHGTVRHRTAPHGRRHLTAGGTARQAAPHGRWHRTAGHDTAQHRTALRRAVQLAKRSGAGVLFACFQLRSWA